MLANNPAPVLVPDMVRFVAGDFGRSAAKVEGNARQVEENAGQSRTTLENARDTKENAAIYANLIEVPGTLKEINGKSRKLWGKHWKTKGSQRDTRSVGDLSHVEKDPAENEAAPKSERGLVGTGWVGDV